MSQKWGGYQMLVNIAKHKSEFDAISGYKDTVTDHATVDVLSYMDYKSELIGCENKLHKLLNK